MRLVNQGSRLIGQPSIHPALQLCCMVICSPRCWLGNKAVAFDGKFSHFESWLNLEMEMIWLELNVTSNNEGNLFVCFPRLCVVYFSASSNQSRPDAAVMQDLKASLVIPKRLKWSDPDPCQWSHVICSDDGQVTNIELQDQNRKGTVPPILKKLSSMAVMYLENNQLRGPIPSLVGLRYLQVVMFDNNSFSYMSPDFFTGLASLRYFSLSNNPIQFLHGKYLKVWQMSGAWSFFLHTRPIFQGPFPILSGPIRFLS